jgi:hypothetical protein
VLELERPAGMTGSEIAESATYKLCHLGIVGLGSFIIYSCIVGSGADVFTKKGRRRLSLNLPAAARVLAV